MSAMGGKRTSAVIDDNTTLFRSCYPAPERSFLPLHHRDAATTTPVPVRAAISVAVTYRSALKPCASITMTHNGQPSLYLSLERSFHRPVEVGFGRSALGWCS